MITTDNTQTLVQALARIATLEAEESRLLTEITTLRGRVELEASAKREAQELAQKRAKVIDEQTRKLAQLEDALRAARGGAR